MNNKINISDLAETLVDRYGLDKKSVNNFIKEFQNTIIDGLKEDKIVKINGLGTFKLILIAERKSVNIQTGESIVIPAHYKLSFITDNSIKEALNNPASAEITDPLRRMAEQANEINDILKDFAKPNAKDDDSAKRGSLQNETEVVNTEESKPIAKTTDNTEPEKKVVKPIQSTPQKTTNKKSYTWLIWTTLGCLLLMLSGFLYYLYSDEINSLFTSEQPIVVEVKEEPIKATEKTEKDIFSQPINYSECIATEVIRKGTRLAFFAKQYYGHPDFWVYIYEANKEVIDDPNNILMGTKVKIPKLSPELIDTTNVQTIKFAVELAKKYK